MKKKKKRKRRRRKKKGKTTIAPSYILQNHIEANWWADIETSFCYISFNFLILLHFFR